MANIFRNKYKVVSVCVILIAALVFIPTLLGQDSGRGTGQPVSPMKTFAALVTAANAFQLSAAVDIPPATLVSASTGTSDPTGLGVFSPPPSTLGFSFPRAGSTFTILSTGLAASADDPDANQTETPANAPGDDINAELGGLNTNAGTDLVRLTLTLDPPAGATSLSFDFAFYSEEFPDFVGEAYNDGFIAEFGVAPFSSGLSISGDIITAPANFALDTNGNVISVNANFGFDPSNLNPDTGTTYDGTSGLLTATRCLPPNLGSNNVILIFSVFDVGDSFLDSAVFLDNFRWEANPNCEGGVEPVLEGSVRVTKYHDIDDSGAPNAGEPGLQGWVMSLYNASNALVATKITDASGVALFTNVPQGSYTVCETLLSGWTNTDPSDGSGCKAVSVAANQEVPVALGNRPPQGAIDIEKTVADDSIPYATHANFTVKVTNTGQTPLFNVAVSDPLTPACNANIGELAVGGFVEYACTAPSLTADLLNVATATGNTEFGQNVSDSDSMAVKVETPITPGLDIQKTPDDQTITSGGTATFSIKVSNTGNVPLDVTVSDALTPDCNRALGTILAGTSVDFTCSAIGVTTSFVNEAVASGIGANNVSASDSDTANVNVEPGGPRLCQPGDPDYNPEADLSGSLPSRTHGIVTNSSSVCAYIVGLAAYQRFDNTLDSQVLFAYDHPRTVGPNETIDLNITVPECALQVDLFYGDLIVTFDTANGVIYGTRKLASRLSENLPFCGAAP